jgi:hypothetical protein
MSAAATSPVEAESFGSGSAIGGAAMPAGLVSVTATMWHSSYQRQIVRRHSSPGSSASSSAITSRGGGIRATHCSPSAANSPG